jgi:hypothetical protein
MLGEGLAFAALACKSAHGRRLGHSPFGCQFVFSGVGLQLLERQRQLVDRPRRTLGLSQTALFATYKSGYAIAIYIAACAAVSLVASAFMPDYTEKDISMEHDD